MLMECVLWSQYEVNVVGKITIHGIPDNMTYSACSLLLSRTVGWKSEIGSG